MTEELKNVKNFPAVPLILLLLIGVLIVVAVLGTLERRKTAFSSFGPSAVQGEAVPGIAQSALESLPQYMPGEQTRPAANAITTVPLRPACLYANQVYSEGAVRPVRALVLICVQRVWNADDSTGELVWEPLSSPRLTTFRQATGLSASLIKAAR
jgi:hypothetical protein